MFKQLQIPAWRQKSFIDLWHRNPRMTVTELARKSGLSRPTCYKLIRLLRERGDERGCIRDGERIARESAGAVGTAGLAHYRRADLLRVITQHEEYVNETLSYLCGLDASFKRFRKSNGEVDVIGMVEYLKGKNARRNRKAASQFGL